MIVYYPTYSARLNKEIFLRNGNILGFVNVEVLSAYKLLNISVEWMYVLDASVVSCLVT